MRIAKFAKSHQIPVYYYISPQVWAWKKNRVYIKKYVENSTPFFRLKKIFTQNIIVMLPIWGTSFRCHFNLEEGQDQII